MCSMQEDIRDYSLAAHTGKHTPSEYASVQTRCSAELKAAFVRSLAQLWRSGRNYSVSP